MLRRSLRPVALGAAVTLALLGTACSRDDEAPAADASSSTVVATVPDPPRSCPPEPVTPAGPDVSDAGANTYRLRAGDGVALLVHLYPAAVTPAPTLLASPGWASLGATPDAPSESVAGPLAIEALRARGYNVVTWDRRGFGGSGGAVGFADPDAEGLDVVAIVDWIASRPEARLDGARDPRLGMYGGSYGAGIQLVAAALDCRIDAITPDMMTTSWRASLAPTGAPKVGWLNPFAVSAGTALLPPEFIDLADAANGDGVLSRRTDAWLDTIEARDRFDEITVPTLLVQGTVDTLFTLAEAQQVFDSLAARSVPVAMAWYCGGHGLCRLGPEHGWTADAAVAWLDRHVRDVAAAPPVPVFTTVDQAGVRWAAPHGPVAASWLTGVGDGALVLDDGSRAGPPTSREGVVSALDETMLAMTPAPVAPERAIEIPVSVPADSFVAGSPRLTLRYLGASGAGLPTTRVYAQVVDPATGEVVGGQITPIEVVLDGRPHVAEVALEAVSWRADGAARLVLQIVATTPLYTDPALGGSIAVWGSEVELPVMADLERVGGA